ncbi:glycosyltransferase family 4 protein [Clostridium aminobutyricum]|uniref:Glycosyltransferase n=1 Tax=Clostridium aminobutyricum TaxID=33953 RepID=A0A939IJY6_CLOAM|nr:glycosyltransferase [Clostridium aminobutyricum]MBN7774044.1 glycosyltransferase [Clostridium aminobutyricum]
MKIAYFDHSYHKQTLSTKFLIDMLVEKDFEVEYIWDDFWRGGEKIRLADYLGKFDVYIFFQLLPEFDENTDLTCFNLVYIPMLDSYDSENLLYRHSNEWEILKNFKVLNFSKSLHVAMSSIGIISKYVKYFPNPEKYFASNKVNKSAFFWQRNSSMVNWDMVKDLLGKLDLESIHIHMANDPGTMLEEIAPQDIEKYHIEFTNWFETKNEYIEKVQSKTLYIAPRISEGIGMSFLEAMAMGKCVIAPNLGTMNEYIIDGVNGYLYDVEEPREITFKDIATVCRNARVTIEEGFPKWRDESIEIINYLFSDSKELYKKLRYIANSKYNENQTERVRLIRLQESEKEVLADFLNEENNFIKRENRQLLQGLEEKEAVIQDLAKHCSEKDNAIRELTNQCIEKETTIQDLDRQCLEKEAVIQELTKQCLEKETLIQNLTRFPRGR